MEAPGKAWLEAKAAPVYLSFPKLLTGALETAAEFGRRLLLEAWTRVWARALIRVERGEGAEWIWNLAALHFPDIIRSVDLYHARQHLWEVPRTFYPHPAVHQKAWTKVPQKCLLDKEKIKRHVAGLHAIKSSNPEAAEKLHELSVRLRKIVWAT